jgi:hypothetical protein
VVAEAAQHSVGGGDDGVLADDVLAGDVGECVSESVHQ